MQGDFHKQFVELDTNDLPEFGDCRSVLDKALWVLRVAKDKLGVRKLTAQQIASVIRSVKEVSIEAKSITQSLNRAGDKIYARRENGEILYEIMKSGKDYVMSLSRGGAVEVFYFEPEKRYSSKKFLKAGILHTLCGELRVVDPYCGERTLDVLNEVKSRSIKFLTKIENLNEKTKNRFLRELQDFKTENTGVEFRNYPGADLHDRYIISPSYLVIIGHSIKDLGAKESFAIVLNQASIRNICEALSENFDTRWEQSNPL